MKRKEPMELRFKGKSLILLLTGLTLIAIGLIIQIILFVARLV